MKILLTGAAGVGKSSICQELAERGYTAIDGDHISGYKSKLTRRFVDFMKADSLPSEKRWRKYCWAINPRKLAAALDSDDMIFICGAGSNLKKHFKKFDKIILLTASEKNIRERLQKRTNNNFGKTKNELKMVLNGLDRSNSYFRKSNAIEIDTDKSSIEQVTDNVLQAVS